MAKLNKKIAAVLVALVAGMFFNNNVNAQIRVGGTASLGFSSSYNAAMDATHDVFSVNLMPSVEYLFELFDFQWAAGVAPYLSMEMYHSRRWELDYSSLGIAPYLRYEFMQMRNFDFWAELSMGLYHNKGYGKNFNFDVCITPVISYHIVDNWYAETSLGFLSMGLCNHFYENESGVRNTSAATYFGPYSRIGYSSLGVVYQF